MTPKQIGQAFALFGLFLCLSLLTCVPAVVNTPEPPQPDQLEPLLANRRYAEAVDLLEKATAERPTDPAPLVKMGQIYVLQQRWPLAEDAFNRALVRHPGSAPATAGLAEIRLNQGDWPAAQKLWTDAAQLNPALPGVFTGQGRTALFRLDFGAARAAFLEQLNHAPPDAEALWYLAALDAPLNVAAANERLLSIPAAANPDVLARRDYLLATLVPFAAQSPRSAVAQAVGAALVQARLWPLAVHALQVAVAQNANQSDAKQAESLAFLGHALAQAGQPALDLFEQARRLDPDSALPLYFYGIYLRQQNALTAAETLFTQAIELDPNNAAIYAELAQTKAAQGDFAAAEAQFEAAVGAGGSNPDIQLLRIRFHGGRGYRVAEAGIPAAEALLQADESNAEAHDWLGWMYFLTGDTGQAEEHLRQAIELAPDAASAHYRLGRLLENSAPTDAAAQYRRAVDLDTQGFFREESLKGLQRLAQLTESN